MRSLAIRALSKARILLRCFAKTLAMTILAVSLPAAPQASHRLLNRPAPEFVRRDLNGQRVDLKAYRGKVVLLTFWATWCAPCRVEMPRFVEWQRQYGRAGLQIVGVSMDDDAAPVRELCGRNGVTYPIVMGDAKLGLRYGGVLGLPLTYVVDRGGIIRARFEGEADLNAMENAIAALLGKRNSVTSR
jgi:cytochrome c biogenesis protein CcmG, thiol:disulfide interchange protein DsbE